MSEEHKRKIRESMLEKYGPDYYKKLAKVGGQCSSNKGFKSAKVGVDGLTGPERAQMMGSAYGRSGKLK